MNGFKHGRSPLREDVFIRKQGQFEDVVFSNKKNNKVLASMTMIKAYFYLMMGKS